MRLKASCFVVLVVACVAFGVLFLSFLRLALPTPLSSIHAPFVSPASPPQRHVTRSLAELRLRRVPELSDHVLLFNHVPKAGGELVVLLLQWLQGVNGFRHLRLPGGSRRKLNRTEQKYLVEEVYHAVKKEAVPISLDRHVYFVNFTQFDRQSPIYINFVRDPVDKAASRFYYKRVSPNPKNPDLGTAPKHSARHFNTNSFNECVLSKEPECVFQSGQPYDLSIPYFCGQEEWCMVLNNQWAMEKAKANVERYFPVVGVLEELNATLGVLEKRIPYFFHGIQQLYFHELFEPHMNKNYKRPQEVNLAVRKVLQHTLETEYEFYHWLQARLLRQHG